MQVDVLLHLKRHCVALGGLSRRDQHLGDGASLDRTPHMIQQQNLALITWAGIFP